MALNTDWETRISVRFCALNAIKATRERADRAEKAVEVDELDSSITADFGSMVSKQKMTTETQLAVYCRTMLICCGDIIDGNNDVGRT